MSKYTVYNPAGEKVERRKTLINVYLSARSREEILVSNRRFTVESIAYWNRDSPGEYAFKKCEEMLKNASILVMAGSEPEQNVCDDKKWLKKLFTLEYDFIWDVLTNETRTYIDFTNARKQGHEDVLPPVYVAPPPPPLIEKTPPPLVEKTPPPSPTVCCRFFRNRFLQQAKN